MNVAVLSPLPLSSRIVSSGADAPGRQNFILPSDILEYRTIVRFRLLQSRQVNIEEVTERFNQGTPDKTLKIREAVS